MKKIFQTIVALCALLLFTCCSNQQQPQKVWEEVKLRDLAPSNNLRQTLRQISFVDFQILIFEIPADNVSKLDEISKILYLQSIQFNNFNAFGANSFSTGLGRMSMGDKILSLLLAADGKRTGTISLALNEGQADDVPINRLFSRNEIFYTAADGTTKSIPLGPGILALRMKTEKDPVFKGVCNVTMTPVQTSGTTTWLAGQIAVGPGNTVFESCSMSMKMSPGDFIFLRPQEYINNQMSLGGLFFSRPSLKPVVMAYLIVCTGINDSANL